VSATRGQAWRWTRRLIALPLAIILAGLLGLGSLAWRLAERPLELPQLARWLEAAVNARTDGVRLDIGQAAIAWEGFRGGTGAPLDIRLRDVRLQGPQGGSQLDLPDAAVTLSFGALLRGTIAPATIALRRPRLRAVLAPDGSVALGLLPPEGGDAPAGAEEPGLQPLAMLAALMRPAHDRDPFTALRRITIDGGEALLVDPLSGRRWALIEPHLDLRRAATGGLAAEGRAIFQSGGVAAPVTLIGSAQGTPMTLAAGMMLPALRPKELAAIWPGLSPLAVLDLPVSLTAGADFDAELRPGRLEARLVGGAGAVVVNQARLPVAGFEATLEGSGRRLRMREGQLRLPGAEGRAGPALTGRVEVLKLAAGWQATLDATAEPLSLADLPRLWPAELAPALRSAALQAAQGGTLRDTTLHSSFTVPEALDGVTLGETRLGLTATDLRIEPVKGVRVAIASAELAATGGPDRLRIERLALRLPPTAATPAGQPVPSILAEGLAERRDGGWALRGAATLDRLVAADMPAYWPTGIGKGHERDWMIENVTAGLLRNGHWTVEASAPETLDAISVTSFAGAAEFSDATVHWLRPVPPVQGVSGTAEFSLKEIVVRGRGGRQMLTEARPSGLELKAGLARFYNLDTEPGDVEIRGQLAGPLADAVTILRHPKLKLFDRRPLVLNVGAGRADATVTVGFPLWHDVKIEQVAIRATARVTEAKLLGALLNQDLERLSAELTVDTAALRATGQGSVLGAAVKLTTEMDFRDGPANQVIERATLGGRFDARQIGLFGLDVAPVLGGTAAVEARTEKRRNGIGQATARADLREARLGLEGITWTKPVGTPGSAEAVLRLQGDSVAAMESFRVDAPGLALRGSASFLARSQLDRVELTDSQFSGSRFSGTVTKPGRDGAPWPVALRGPLLDIRTAWGPEAPPRDPKRARVEEPGPPLALDLHFDRVLLGEGRSLHGVRARALLDAAGVLRQAEGSGRTGAGPGQGEFQFGVTPHGTARGSADGEPRAVRLGAADGGALLAALDLVSAIRGGRLSVTASYPDSRPGAALSGTAELDQFALRDAPVAARLLQAASIYGVVEALQGGSGLVFTRLVAPFSLTPEVLTLTDAHAFSASLGVTAKGRVLRGPEIAELEGTIVPSYMFNTLLGRLPGIGRLFSPEVGGGLIAATYRIQGPLADPQISVNPLAALTPGVLRGLFGLGATRPGEAAR